MADQIGDRAGHFHAGGTGANQNKRQQVAMTAGVFLSFSLLERPEDLIPNRYGVGQVFQSWSILLKFIVSEVIMACACSQNQVVVVDPHVLAVHAVNQNVLFIRGILRNQPNTSVFMGEVIGVSPDEKYVLVNGVDRENVRIDYDYLILATG